MTFRITRLDHQPGTLLRVAGRLEQQGLAELERSCRESVLPLTIDLSELTHADKKAVVTLSQLATEGAHLVGASPYLAMLLDSAE